MNATRRTRSGPAEGTGKGTSAGTGTGTGTQADPKPRAQPGRPAQARRSAPTRGLQPPAIDEPAPAPRLRGEPPPVPELPDDPALRTADQVRAVATLLSTAADAYNRRLKAEAPELGSGEVFARLQEEQRLRGIANQLYFEAGAKTIDGAVGGQAELESALQAAHDRLERFDRFARALDLFADLMVLGGALLAGKPSTIVAALKEVRSDLSDG